MRVKTKLKKKEGFPLDCHPLLERGHSPASTNPEVVLYPHHCHRTTFQYSRDALEGREFTEALVSLKQVSPEGVALIGTPCRKLV